MPRPDPNADEATVELDENAWAIYLTYVANAEYWTNEAKQLKAKFIESMGSATAALVGGAKVVTYRPSKKYAEAAMQKDHPNLTQHYRHTVQTEVFDVELFVRAHPEIAEQYRVRSFNKVET